MSTTLILSVRPSCSARSAAASTRARPCTHTRKHVSHADGGGRHAPGYPYKYRAARHLLVSLGAQRVQRQVEAREAGALQGRQPPRQRHSVARHADALYAGDGVQLLCTIRYNEMTDNNLLTETDMNLI